MEIQLRSVNEDLEAVSQEISSLELALLRAQTRKKNLTTQKAQLEKSIRAAKLEKEKGQMRPIANGADSHLRGESPEELQAKIHALRRQIAETEKKKEAAQTPRSPSNNNEGKKKGSFFRIGDYQSPMTPTKPTKTRLADPASPTRTSVVAPLSLNSCSRLGDTLAPPSPTPSSAATSPATPKYQLADAPLPPLTFSQYNGKNAPASPTLLARAAVAASISRTKHATALAGTLMAPTPQSAPTSPVSVVIDKERYTKKNEQHSGDKPAWAFSQEKQGDDRVVDTDPIRNPLLKHGDHSPGYRRQVLARDLSIEKGVFVKHQIEIPDPRKTWIVVRLNGEPIPGKLVMHLHGKDVDKLIGHFSELKGNHILRKGRSIIVEGKPPLYITTAAVKGLDGKRGVYGVVQEGHEILNAILAAGDETQLEIKQAHIFPIKKSKGGV